MARNTEIPDDETPTKAVDIINRIRLRHIADEIKKGNDPKPGYHIKQIVKHEYGEPEKILEEVEEFLDALRQESSIMALLELSDLYGAIQGYLEKHHSHFNMDDIKIMSNITRRAFKNAYRH